MWKNINSGACLFFQDSGLSIESHGTIKNRYLSLIRSSSDGQFLSSAPSNARVSMW